MWKKCMWFWMKVKILILLVVWNNRSSWKMVIVKCKLILVGCCYVVKVVNVDLYKGKLYVFFLEKNFKNGGCNNNGCIIVCYIGGGYK